MNCSAYQMVRRIEIPHNLHALSNINRYIFFLLSYSHYIKLNEKRTTNSNLYTYLKYFKVGTYCFVEKKSNNTHIAARRHNASNCLLKYLFSMLYCILYKVHTSI